MAKTSVRHARTPHRGDAHNARLTPQGEAFLFSRLPCARGGGLPKARRKGCHARATPTFTTLPPRFARHPPLHREGKGRDNSPLRSAPSRIGLPQKDAIFLWDFHREGKGFRYYNVFSIQFCSSAKPQSNPATIAGGGLYKQKAPESLRGTGFRGSGLQCRITNSR